MNRFSGEPPLPRFTSTSSIPHRPAIGLYPAPPGCRLARILAGAATPPPWNRHLPYFHCGLPAQPNLGWQEVAQWNSSFVIFPLEMLKSIQI
jgi:hypothetical protein